MAGLTRPHDEQGHDARRATAPGPGRAPDAGTHEAATLEPATLESMPAGTLAPGSSGRPPLRPASLLGLQRSAGNAAVARFMERRAGRAGNAPAPGRAHRAPG